MGQSQGRKKACNVELIFLVLIPRLSKNLLVNRLFESLSFIYTRCWYGWLRTTWWFIQSMKFGPLHVPCRAPPTSAASARTISDPFLWSPSIVNFCRHSAAPQPLPPLHFVPASPFAWGTCSHLQGCLLSPDLLCQCFRMLLIFYFLYKASSAPHAWGGTLFSSLYGTFAYHTA